MPQLPWKFHEDTTGVTYEEYIQEPRFMEAATSFLRWHRAVASNISERASQNGNSWNSFLVFSGDMPPTMPGLVEFLNETLGFRRQNGGDYFIGPGVEEFFEQVTSDSSRQPPSRPPSIHALPTVKISRRHVRADSTCAVCKDRFELGSQARKLPCKHLVYSNNGATTSNSWTSVDFVVSGTGTLIVSSNRRVVQSSGGHRNERKGVGVEEIAIRKPALRSAINALPKVKVSKEHIHADSTCAVCKDKFELGSQARKLPCKHINATVHALFAACPSLGIVDESRVDAKADEYKAYAKLRAVIAIPV
ncbi:hypothetical protein SASPL_129177 [Salvia splendens]|uniref:RING-type E3 ubiquitin transferase n=1 Tax=Salvia splendens TaxID=180675 RepID=A0A8X8ZNG6_SALSN|nr:hypothetical protein SASPL_129177 [Salvia splendens]